VIKFAHKISKVSSGRQVSCHPLPTRWIASQFTCHN